MRLHALMTSGAGRAAAPRALRAAWVTAVAAASVLALAGFAGACDGEGASAPSDEPDALAAQDDEGANSVDMVGADVATEGTDGVSDPGPGDASDPETSPDTDAAAPLPVCETPASPPPTVAFRPVDTDGLSWFAQGLTEWEGDVTVQSAEPWIDPVVGPQDGPSGWIFALDAGDQVYTFRAVLDGHPLPFAVGDALYAELWVSSPEFFVQTAQLTLTDASGALVLHASQGTSCGLPVDISSFTCADSGECGILEGRGPLTFPEELPAAPALALATVPDRAATTVGQGDEAYLVLAADVWASPDPTATPACSDALTGWCQLAILPAPTTP